ncbi:PPE family protein [Nocardia amikacinitolerans]|uniref:PPE family protein n=2 Tax=Nocardia amikacinitolerans TaxID=756689 RepID=A0A285M120_9NOCA|nr:PPE family protein [Nocardia amikacinitolerans]
MSEIGATNPWEALRAQAQGGALEFHPRAALDVVEVVVELLGGVLAIRENATQVEHFEPLSNLSSGEALAAKFANKGVELGRILDGHVAVLRNMIETFVDAGRQYARVEDLNAEELGRVTTPREASTALGRSPESTPIAGDIGSDGRYRDPGDWLDPVAAHEVDPMSDELREHDDFEPSTIRDDIENPNALLYEDLYELGQSIRAQQVADAGGRWAWMSAQLDAITVEYANRVDSMTVGQWRGAGREAAVAAVRAYADGVRHLSNSMGLMADNLAYTAGWLEATRVSMPQEPMNPAGSTRTLPANMGPYGMYSMSYTVEDPTAEYQEALRQTYGVGIDVSAVRVPILPPVESAFAQVPMLEQGVEGGGGGQGSGGASAGTDTVTAAVTPSPVTVAGAALPVAPARAPGGGTSPLPTAYSEPDARPAPTSPVMAGSAPHGAGQGVDGTRGVVRSPSRDLGQGLPAALGQAAQQVSAAQRPPSGSAPSAAARSLPHHASAEAGSGARGAGHSTPTVAPKHDPARIAKLFPRAALPVEPGGVGAADRLAAASNSPGVPGPAGMGGAANSGDKRDWHRRAAYLESSHHFEEALGEAPRVVNTPVIER